MKTILVIAYVIYILSFFRMYFWVKNAFSKGGIYEEGGKPIKTDLYLTIIPFINTLASFVVTLISVTGFKKKPTTPKDYSKFFNIKK